MDAATTTNSATTLSPRSLARAAGLFWLLTILMSMFAFIIAGRFMVAGNATATAANLTEHEGLQRLAFLANLLATVCYLIVTLLMYVLLKPVNRTVSLLGSFFSIVGCAIGTVSCLLFLAPLTVLKGASAPGGVTVEQAHDLALTLLTLSGRANDIGLVFFACHVLTIGYLIRRSAFLPRVLGTLLFITGICYLTNSFAVFLALPFRAYLMPLVGLAGLLGEGALTGWLLTKSVNVQRWLEQSGGTLAKINAAPEPGIG
jgi:uncharacterized protein DUF4386